MSKRCQSRLIPGRKSLRLLQGFWTVPKRSQSLSQQALADPRQAGSNLLRNGMDGGRQVSARLQQKPADPKALAWEALLGRNPCSSHNSELSRLKPADPRQRALEAEKSKMGLDRGHLVAQPLRTNAGPTADPRLQAVPEKQPISHNRPPAASPAAIASQQAQPPSSSAEAAFPAAIPRHQAQPPSLPAEAASPRLPPLPRPSSGPEARHISRERSRSRSPTMGSRRRRDDLRSRSRSRSKGVRRQGQHPSRSRSRSPTRHDGRRDKRRRFASSPPSGRRLLRSEKSPAGDRALDRDRNRSRSAGTHRPDRKAHPFPGGAREVSPLDAPLEDSADEPPKPYMPHRSPPRGRKRSRGDSPAARNEDNLPKTPKQQDVHGADRPENEPEGRMERGGQEARLSSLKKGKSKADGQGTRTKASKKQPKKGSRGEPEVQTPGAGITDATEGQLRKHARIEAPPKRPSSPRQTDLGDISRKSRDSHKPSEAPDADAQDDLPNSSKAESSRDAAQKEQRGEDAASRDRAANPDGAAPRGHRSPSQERGTPGHAHKHGSDAETPSHVRTSDSGRNGNGQQSASVPGKTNLIFAHPERQACSKLPESVVSKSPADATSARVRFPMASQAPSPQVLYL